MRVVVCPVVSVGGGGEPGEGLVWPVVVVFGSPVLEHDLGFEEVGEVFGVEAFVSEASVEGLDVGVLPGRSGLDVGGVGAPDAAPVAQRGSEMSSGPLSILRWAGAPRWATRRSTAATTPSAAMLWAAMLWAASTASASRVNSSTMLRSLMRRRSAVSSNWKSRATRRWGVGRAAARRCRL